ncbi:NACHT, LRR and PYD domains-containing protein 12-like isoform X1 [Ctenopharyngodon idella]|uniref:NACHT, LRR and PYD domains-containing protein 12-like isoform X1 n=1 Tax=Ctenopharyngodon idella TaxID=7959 RepID=UPI00223127CE|nr:NACHT, LRR and PYD domains-containing protein 12-like isoform X1 [Ctenopharyngodon idella]
MASIEELLLNSLMDLIEPELSQFQWHLKKHERISNSEMENADRLKTVDKMVASFGPEEAVKTTLEILRKMNHNNLAEQLENNHKQGSTADDSQVILHDYTETSLKLKKKLKQDYNRILIGNSETGHRKCLNDIYTDLYVVENETGGRVNDHEIESNQNRLTAKEKPIKCNDMFKVQSTGQQNRKVLTMGIAGVGKTVSVNKFIFDWAEGKENQDIVFIFPLPFRRLNLIKEEYSLMGMLNKYFFSSPEELPSLPEGDGKVMFIFDGLDECRFPLNFKEDDIFTNVNEKTTVSKIIINLMKTHLVPSALIWITSRPAAASLIPRDYTDQVTEVRGFNNEQKEQYFIKNSPKVSENIIRHIRKFRSLYIMCHIPVFCWISLTVLQPLLARESNDKTPTTLTGMYTSFLISQQQQMEKKYCDGPEPEANARSFDEIILKLGKLAFKQLEKGNLIFYKKDLEECGLDVNEGSVYSGLCTQMFQEEKVSARKVYSFIHLSIQEFLAALYVFLTGTYKNPFLETWEKLTWNLSKKPLFMLHKAAVKKALQSENGHLDLFLRFLLGLSLESNQNDLKELLPKLKLKTENMKITADYIKKKIEKEKSVERTINLFHCLSELNDDFIEEIQKNLSSGNFSAQNLSSAQWSGLVFLLLMSEETQEKFEMQKYRRSDESLMRLLPVIKNTRRALLQCCNLTAQSCELLSSTLQSSNSVLRELDLSNNDLQDSGVKIFSKTLRSPNCQLEILKLPTCNLTAQCCESLSSALQSSFLRELDLSNNDLQDSGVKLLSDGLKDHKSPNCQLKILRFEFKNFFFFFFAISLLKITLLRFILYAITLFLFFRFPTCKLTAQCCESLSSVLQSSNSFLRELDLSNNDLQDSGVKLLSDGLKSLNCQLEIMRLSGCMVTEKGCGYVSLALSSNPSHLRELDLSYNHPGDSGVKLLTDKLNHPDYRLDKLNVDHGGEIRITAGVCKYSHQLTLDLNTTHKRLHLSEGNRVITDTVTVQSYPDHPDRFEGYNTQVLCRDSVCGRCYWEIEWSGNVCISLSYKSISRKGRGIECLFGSNDQSWSLYCSSSSYSFSHNNTWTKLPVESISSRIGVYVDHSVGTLSFYSVSGDTMSLIHTVQTTFTQSLYPGFHVDTGSSVKLC